MSDDSDDRDPLDLTSLLTAIGERNLVENKREVEIAQMIRAGEEARRRLDEDRVLANTEEAELERLAVLGVQAEAEFAVLHEGMVTSIAKRHVGHGLSMKELVQAGNRGLIEALKAHNWSRSFKFSPTARWFIRSAILQAIKEKARNPQATAVSSWSPGQDVPGWFQYFPSLDNAAPEQTAFYQWMVGEFREGRTPDVHGNLSYLFLFCYSVVERFLTSGDYGQLAHWFGLLRGGYGKETKVGSYLNLWQADSALLTGHWDEAWEFKRRERLRVVEVVNIRRRCTETGLTAQDLHALLLKDNGLTPHGKKRLLRVNEAADRLLDERHQTVGANMVETFCKRFARPLDEEDLDLMADECCYLVSASTLKRLNGQPNPEPGTVLPLYSGIPMSFWPDYGLRRRLEEVARPDGIRTIGWAVEAATLALCKSVLREAEILVRRAEGLPGIGEGWVSETELFQLIRRSFPDTAVVQHARPPWLTPQHLDVYLPEHNVGIEYQGAQHIEPVDYFGGEAALRQVQARDRRKLNLCRRHGCKLIYVYQGYDSEDVLEQVQAALGP